MKVESIREFTDSRGVALKVQAEAGLITGVKVLGLLSRNGRTYVKEAVARAAALYEGAKVNVDHPNGKADQPRSYADRIGALENVRLGPGDSGLFADFRFNPKHALAEQLIWDAEHNPQAVGFSHNITGKTSRRGQTVVVEEITGVTSVDLVADPATTRGLFEGDQANHEEANDMPITLEQLKAEQPDLIEAIGKAAVEAYAKSKEVTDQREALEVKVKTLTEQVDRFEAEKKTAEHRAAVDKEIAEAKLPETVLTEVFRSTLYGESDQAKRTALIEDRQAIAKAAGVNRPRSQEQPLTEGQTPDTRSTKQFAAAIAG